jgi:hypothetical protein
MICPDCDLVCDSAVAFKYHMRHMHSKHACMHCSKAFANRGAFERHATTHAISANCQCQSYRASLMLCCAEPDDPSSAAQAQEQCLILGAYPGFDSFASGTWRWKRPSPRPWFDVESELAPMCADADT